MHKLFQTLFFDLIDLGKCILQFKKSAIIAKLIYSEILLLPTWNTSWPVLLRTEDGLTDPEVVIIPW